MAPRVYMIVDSNNLAARMFFAKPPMAVDGRQTGAIYGFLEQIIKLRDELGVTTVVFCFDLGEPLRKKVLPIYQSGRESSSAYEPSKDKKFLHRQLYELRRHILPQIGFPNVFSEDGYEADDLVAATCNHWAVKRGVIVSSDKDLYQCLRSRPDKDITQYDLTLKQEVDARWFTDKYGTSPLKWPFVKAAAGCDSDNIPGVAGVGEKTAIRYERGELKPDSVACKAIKRSRELIERNELLTTLPYPGLKVPELKEDQDSFESWECVLGDLNASSLMRRVR